MDLGQVQLCDGRVVWSFVVSHVQCLVPVSLQILGAHKMKMRAAPRPPPPPNTEL